MEFFAMRGHLGQHVFVFPDQNIMIVRLGKRQDKKTEREIYPRDQQKQINTQLLKSKANLIDTTRKSFPQRYRR